MSDLSSKERAIEFALRQGDRCRNYGPERTENEDTIVTLADEVERLQGIRPEFPPRPPDGEGLPRYGIRWNGPEEPLAVPMADGYWTPWHLAARYSALEPRAERFQVAGDDTTGLLIVDTEREFSRLIPEHDDRERVQRLCDRLNGAAQPPRPDPNEGPIVNGLVQIADGVLPPFNNRWTCSQCGRDPQDVQFNGCGYSQSCGRTATPTKPVGCVAHRGDWNQECGSCIDANGAAQSAMGERND